MTGFTAINTPEGHALAFGIMASTSSNAETPAQDSPSSPAASSAPAAESEQEVVMEDAGVAEAVDLQQTGGNS